MATQRRTIFDRDKSTAVMTFNLKNGQDAASWNARKDLLVQVVRDANPLLLGTQEGYDWQLRYMLDGLPGYDYVGASRGSMPEDEFSAILYDTSRVNVLKNGTVWLSATPDVPGSAFEGEIFPRIVTWGLCEVSGHDHPLLFVNTHLTYEDWGVDAQVAVLVEQLATFAPEDADVILTGDFNQSPDSNAWKTFHDHGFTDAFEFAVEQRGPVATFHDWAGIEISGASDTPGKRIDWILYRPSDGRTVPRNTVVETVDTHDGDIYPSDHFPVVLKHL